MKTTTHSGEGIKAEHFSLGRFEVLVAADLVRQGDQTLGRGGGGEVGLMVLLEGRSQRGFDLGRREAGGCEDGAQVGEYVVHCLRRVESSQTGQSAV